MPGRKQLLELRRSEKTREACNLGQS